MPRNLKKRLLFNFLSLPLGLLAVAVLFRIIAAYKQPVYLQLISFYEQLVIAWGVVIVLWHISVLVTLSESRKQGKLFRWSLAVLLYPYAIGLCFCLFYSGRYIVTLYHRHNTITEIKAVTVDVEAIPLVVGAENAEVITAYTTPDTAYLLTLRTYVHHNDSLPGMLRLAEYSAPLPIDYYALHCYALANGNINEVGLVNILSDSVDKTTSTQNPGRAIHILTTKRNAKPCQGIYSIRVPHTLVDKCVDTNKVLGVLNGYNASIYRVDKERWVPVNYVDKYNTCYTVVSPEAEDIYDRSNKPVAHVAVFKNGKTTIYRVWLPGKNNAIEMRKCFVQGNYCYVYHPWTVGGKPPYVCKFRLPDQ